MAKAIIFFLLHLASVQSSSPTNISVNTNDQLEKLLCDYQPDLYSNDVIITLNSTITHEISSGNFCTVNISHSLTIKSDSVNTLAHINCIPNNASDNDEYWTRGFAFYGINGSLTMRGLNFSYCGTNLTTLNNESINLINSTSSTIHFTQYHAAVLVLADVGSLYAEHIHFMHYNGFAIVAVNLPNASLNYLNVSWSHNMYLAGFAEITTGSGVLVLFSNQVAPKNYSKYSLSIINSFFEFNFAFNQYWRKDLCIDGLHHLFYSSLPAINAAGLTILYAQHYSIPATVNVSKTKFWFCSGYFTGAMLIIYINSKLDSQTIISDSFFSNNSLISRCRGGAVASFFVFKEHNYSPNKIYHVLTIINTIFTNNGEPYLKKLKWSAGAVYIFVFEKNDHSTKPKIHFIFRNTSFVDNMAQNHGAGVYVNVHPNNIKSEVYFLMESITAYSYPDSRIDNFDYVRVSGLPASVFYFINIIRLIINGSEACPSSFSENYGSVFEILKSNVVLQGMLSFDNNTADHGPAFQLLEDTIVYLKEGLRANFTNNKAKSLGGAIYASGDVYIMSQCTLQLESKTYKSISMSFINNTAQIAGNAIYSLKLFESNCYINTVVHHKKIINIYEKIFENTSLTDIVSFGAYIVVCNKKLSYALYPGELLQIPISVNDSNHHHTFSVLTVSVVQRKNDRLKNIDWFFKGEQDTYTTIIKGTTNCTNINLTIHTTHLSKSNRKGLLLFSISNPSNITAVRVILNNCPPGFKLDTSKGACGCLPNFEKIVNHYSNEKELKCNINNVSFTRPYRYLWVGLGSRSSIEYSVTCPFGYCNIYSHHDKLKFNDSGSFVASSLTGDSKPLCHGSRTGDLCGKCISNYSAVFGSTVCQMCTNKLWLITSVIYILAGPLIVFLLYTLKLTLATGTLNSIIFFAQVANARVAGYLKIPCSDCGNALYFIRSTSVFISWLNLNLGFPLCFYNGMTEIDKAGLSLFFPVYLIFIVGFLVILSKCSSKVSNRLSKSSVQVLVTVVHLSFTQLLQAILNVFKPAEIYIENETSYNIKTVWYYDGTTTYASSEHQWLMIITSVVVGFILIPYMVVILFGKFLLKLDRSREYIRPFFEAIHAPYKANKWYWFAINQLFVLYVYLIDTIQGLKNLRFSLLFELLMFLIIQVFIASQSCFLSFKNKLLNAVNIFLLLTISTAFYTAIYFFHDYPKEVAIYISVSFCSTIIIFCLIIIYHILLVTNKLDKLFLLLQSTRTLFSGKFKKKKTVKPSNERRRGAYYNDTHDTGDYTQAREPLLEWIST